MRSKSFPVRYWPHPKSLDTYTSPASLQVEANERFASGVTTPHCDSGDADVETVPDTCDVRDVPHKKRLCLEKGETSRGVSEQLDACIVCDKSDELVSRCSGIDCLLSFHGECLNPELGSNEALANSYCPYCWFKILALKHKSVAEKALGADKEMESRDEVEESVPKSQEDTALYGDENRNQDHSVDSTDIVSNQELQGEKDACSSEKEQLQVENDSDKSREEDMPLGEEPDYQPEEDTEKLELNTDKSGDMNEDIVIDEAEASDDEDRRVDAERLQDAEEDKGDETTKDQAKINTVAGEKGDVSPFLSMQESSSGKEHDPVQQNEKLRGRRRRRLILNDVDSDISSNGSTNEQNGDDVPEQITSSAQVVTSPSGKLKTQERKHSATTEVSKSKTVSDISFFMRDQKRRLFWTPEEEEMLKMGVEKFAAEARKNMPWRKILEMGEKVFHETRTPADLKDKWRNMIGGQRSGKKTN